MKLYKHDKKYNYRQTKSNDNRPIARFYNYQACLKRGFTMWIIMAALSALFAGITAILSKCGVKNTNSDVATALRTFIVLIFAWLMAFITGEFKQIGNVDIKSIIFLVLSGVCTGASWLCYFKALSLGETSKVAAVDKSSTVLSVLIAICVFPAERNLWWLKLIFLAAITVGTYLMTDINRSDKKDGLKWFVFAAFSAIFAACTSVLAKIGIKNVDSNLATAIRTSVVLLMAWLIVFIKNETSLIKDVKKKDFLFIVLSGIATGASWLCYYYALSRGKVSVVVPIDKLSILVTVLFSVIFLKEKLKTKSIIGLSLIVSATVCMAIFT